MPWCEPCDRYLAPDALDEEGGCPQCGTALAERRERAKVPWHFWLFAGSAFVYLGWRLLQGVDWVVQHL